MADTGYNWDASWTAIDTSLEQQEGETNAEDYSAVLDLDGKAACLISVSTVYGDQAKATQGLVIGICRDIDGTNYELIADIPWQFEMEFVQNGTRKRAFRLLASDFQKFKLLLDWNNTTTDAIATSTTKIKYATIPVAS